MTRNRTAPIQVPGQQAVESETVEAQETQEVVESDPTAFAPDDDEAIAAGQAGQARRIAKPRAPVAPADLGGAPDVTRPPEAAINASRETSMAAAMDLDRQGKLQRAVMTEKGWYCPRNSLVEQKARRRNDQPALIDID